MNASEFSKLQQEVEDQKKLNAKLSQRIRSLEKSQRDLEATLHDKDDSIGALNNCIMQLNRLEERGSESEGRGPGRCEPGELAKGEVGGGENKKAHMHQLMDVSRTHPAISVFQKDLQLLELKLRASLSAKCDLEDQIVKLGEDCGRLQADKARLEEEFSMLQQKVEVLKELSHQKELELQKILSQAECAQQQREQALRAVDEKVVPATEEVKIYKRRIREVEAELEKTERSFKNQLATEKKKAHENWLKARNAERLVADEKRQAANLRQRLMEITQKLDMLKEEPGIIKWMPDSPGVQNVPHRGPLSQKGSFGQSPVNGGECSPPPGTEPPGWPPSASLNLARCDIVRADLGQRSADQVEPAQAEASFDPPLPPPPPPLDACSGQSAGLCSVPKGTSEGMPEASSVLVLILVLVPDLIPALVLILILVPDLIPALVPVLVLVLGKSSDSSRGSCPEKDMDNAKVNLEPVPWPPLLHGSSVSMAVKGPPAHPGPPFLGGPMPPHMGYGSPPPSPLCRPFGPRPMSPRQPPPFVTRMGPPLGLRDYAPGMLPGRHDLPLHPGEFLPGPVPFRPPGPLGAQAYFISDPRMPPPPAGLQDYRPPPAGPQDNPPLPPGPQNNPPMPARPHDYALPPARPQDYPPLSHDHPSPRSGPQYYALPAARPHDYSLPPDGPQDYPPPPARPQDYPPPRAEPQDCAPPPARSQETTHHCQPCLRNASHHALGPTTTHHHQPGLRNANHHVPGPRTTCCLLPGTNINHRRLPGPRTTHHRLPGPRTAHHHLLGPRTTHHHLPGPRITHNHLLGQRQPIATCRGRRLPTSVCQALGLASATCRVLTVQNCLPGPRDYPPPHAGAQDYPPASLPGPQEYPTAIFPGSRDYPLPSAGPQLYPLPTAGPQDNPPLPAGA
nr:transport and Golgi organization protein 1 homolog [Cavia porcellus]